MQQKVFLTYGDGIFSHQRERISYEAKATGLFHWIYSLSRDDIKDFCSEHYKVMDGTYSGGFIWKPYIILETLKKLQYNDILIYSDAGCCFTNHGTFKFVREQRFDFYINLINNLIVPVTAFSPWTATYDNDDKKPDYDQSEEKLWDVYVKDKFNLNTDHFKNYPGIEAGCIIIRNIPSAVNIIQLWLDYLIQDDYYLILHHKMTDQKMLNILFYHHYLHRIDGCDFYGEGPIFAARFTDDGQKPGYNLPIL